MTAVCSAGHVSEESDYCSVCGAAVVPATPAPPSAAARPRPAGVCPVCGESRTADARFCEVCRYDFVACAGGAPPTAERAPAAAAASRWELAVTVDPALDTEPDPAAPPPSEPERIFPLDAAEALCGRRDDRQHILPAIPLHDPGASRRHARFLVGRGGAVSLHDLASTNGTKLNGRDVVSGSVVPMAEGDEVTLGRWTRIRLRKRA